MAGCHRRTTFKSSSSPSRRNGKRFNAMTGQRRMPVTYFGVLLLVFSHTNSFWILTESFSIPNFPSKKSTSSSSSSTQRSHQNPSSSSSHSKKNPMIKVMPLTEDTASSSSSSSKTRSFSSSSSSDSEISIPLLDWNASGSIGSLLMQMQRKEEEMRKLNKTLLDKEQALDLSLHNATSGSSSGSSYADPVQDEEIAAAELPPLEEKLEYMDFATAKELDDAVTIRITSSVGKDVKVLELPTLYEILREQQQEEEKVQKDALPPLSRREHYKDRIGRDMRHLAVSIASCIDDPKEWRLFCQQTSVGILPLIDCIREGARSVKSRRDDPSVIVSQSPQAASENNLFVSRDDEESFLAASSACRALRDLCALSLDLAAVITDGLLRANAGEALMEDLVTLLQYANDADIDVTPDTRRRGLLLLRRKRKPSKWKLNFGRTRKEARLQCKLYVLQLMLAMTCASDSAVDALRSTDGLRESVLRCSSYGRAEKTRRWLRYPGEMIKSLLRGKHQTTVERRRRPFIEATSLKHDLNGRVQGTANQILAALGYNEWVPKIPGQKGLRILCLDGGGSRGMTSVIAVDSLVESLGGVQVADCFDLVVGTSTGGIIAFLIGLKRETSAQAVRRYDVLIEKIFTKTALSTPLLLFTTATYDESPFMNILSDILGDYTMLDSRADPAVPYVFAVTSKMSSTPTHVALFRNYNYNGGELPDPFVVKPEEARENLGLSLEMEHEKIRSYDYPRKEFLSGQAPWRQSEFGSRHPGSFRVLQRYALRASTAAPTVFKPVMMGGEMYCDGGIVASNPTAIGIHEARTLFPDVPIELVVSIGTGGFLEQKSAPRIGWDGIIGQIINSATDGEQIHHILEDILGEGGTAQLGRSSVSNTRYMRFNPILGLPDDFPIDITDPKKLELIKRITRDYMNEPEQKRKLQDLADLLEGRRGIQKWFKR